MKAMRRFRYPGASTAAAVLREQIREDALQKPMNPPASTEIVQGIPWNNDPLWRRTNLPRR